MPFCKKHSRHWTLCSSLAQTSSSHPLSLIFPWDEPATCQSRMCRGSPSTETLGGGTPFTVSLPICNVQQATEHLTFKLPFPIWIEMPSSPFFIGQWHSSWLHLISLKHLFLQHQIPLLTQIRWHVSPKTGLIDVTCYSSGWVFLQFHPYKVSTLP